MNMHSSPFSGPCRPIFKLYHLFVSIFHSSAVLWSRGLDAATFYSWALILVAVDKKNPWYPFNMLWFKDFKIQLDFCTSSVFQFQILQNLIHDGRLWLIEALFQPDQVMCYKECHGTTWKMWWHRQLSVALLEHEAERLHEPHAYARVHLMEGLRKGEGQWKSSDSKILADISFFWYISVCIDNSQ